MLSKFYTQYLQGIFTDREGELNRLDRAKEELKKGRPRHMALWGLRRLGKTMLIMEFIRQNLQDKEIIPVYIDFTEACTSPEIFAQRYLGNIAFWYLTRGEGELQAGMPLPFTRWAGGDRCPGGGWREVGGGGQVEK